MTTKIIEETTSKETEKITGNSCKSNCSTYMPLVVVIIVCFLLNAIFTSYMITSITSSSVDSNSIVSKLGLSSNQNIGETVKKAIEESEVKKVGGEDNYKLLNKIYESPTYKDQQSQSIKGYAAQFNITSDDTAANTGTLNLTGNQENTNSGFENSGKMTTDEVSALTKDAYVKGDENSKILWVEYSDVECPFCKRFHQQGTVKAAMEKYQGQISYTFKHFPLSFHQNAMSGSLLLECVGELGGKDKFFEFMDAAYAASESDQETLLGIASGLGLDKGKLTECVASAKYTDKINGDLNGGQVKFAINGTPGNVLINKETGEWVVVSGAQPLSAFEKAISHLLGE